VIAGTPSQLPTQLARLAVTGQAGVDAMLKAGQLSGRLVTVDPATARAIRAGTMVTDKAGEMLGIMRGESSRWGWADADQAGERRSDQEC
jgi:hypothetical protein